MGVPVDLLVDLDRYPLLDQDDLALADIIKGPGPS